MYQIIVKIRLLTPLMGKEKNLICLFFILPIHNSKYLLYIRRVLAKLPQVGVTKSLTMFVFHILHKDYLPFADVATLNHLLLIICHSCPRCSGPSGVIASLPISYAPLKQVYKICNAALISTDHLIQYFPLVT